MPALRRAHPAANPSEPLVLDGLTDLALPLRAAPKALELASPRPPMAGATVPPARVRSWVDGLGSRLARLCALPARVASPR